MTAARPQPRAGDATRCPVRLSAAFWNERLARRVLASGDARVPWECPCGAWHIGLRTPLTLGDPDDPTLVWFDRTCWWCWRPLRVGYEPGEPDWEPVYCWHDHAAAARKWRKGRRVVTETVMCGHCGQSFERPVGSEQAYLNKTHKRAAEAQRTSARRAADAEVTTRP